MIALYSVLLIIAMCFCIFNYWFQKEKYKRLTAVEIKKLNKLNSPAAWMTYFLLSFLFTVILISYYIYNLYIAIFKLG
ncbi:MAG: hypothetical protein N2484_07065 [Clostridia bacterium]|nr:hypothetical protein [Clostridia bacterium]